MTIVNYNERIDRMAEKFRLPENNNAKNRYIKTALWHSRQGELSIQLGKCYTGPNYTTNQEDVQRGLCYAVRDGLVVEISGKIYLTPKGEALAKSYGLKVKKSAIFRETRREVCAG